ncbi:MAG: 23S rRNA (uracil(1939)-C(5))-methyltransferase RlmD [Lachnospiraceae bacterium]|nr:23S rRNA (uracil(1939)-C(5))-methyltransferase RlmD [Lachnospiraceae bacterium]
MNKNDLVTVEIEDFSHDGAGIGKVNGYALFIKDAVIGDTVSARIMKIKSKYAFAKLEKVITPSSFRVTPECKFHRQCGGCQLQALSYEKQLEFKQNKVVNNLIRIGGFLSEHLENVIEPIIGMENAFRYRNKGMYPVGYDKAGALVTGFYAGRTHDIIANTDCLLGDERNKEILETVLLYMKKNHLNAYNEKTGAGLFRHILIRNSFYNADVMVCFVLNAKFSEDFPKQIEILLPHKQELCDSLSKIHGVSSIIVNFNSEQTNVIMGKKVCTVWGQDKITDKLYIRDTGRFITFKISPHSFYQVNPRQTEKLYALALEYAELSGDETVWDLYCGIGTISLFMAVYAKQVYGVEIIPEAVHDACQNAKENETKNIEFFIGKVEDVLPQKLSDENIHADIIIVDPPRKGCDSECINTMIKMKPKRIIYISCDSATLARDLRILCDNSYELKRFRVIDQFGQSVHVETICLLKLLEG